MEKLLLKNVTIAYPNLFEAKANAKYNAEKKQYTAQIRIYDDQSDAAENMKLIKEAMHELAKGKWGEKAKRYYEDTQDSKNTRWLQRNNEEGFYFFSVKRNESEGAPKVLDGQRNTLFAADGKPRSGDTVNVLISPWIYDNQNSRGYSATLMGVQYVREGTVVIGNTAIATEDDFEILGTDECDAKAADAFSDCY